MSPPNLNLSLDFRSGAPIYVQIMEQIQRQVANGEMKPGDQLPTVRHLATELRINFNTVARAYRLLDEAGLISTQHGRGTYIWQAPSSESIQRVQQQALDEMAARFVREAAQLDCSAEETAAAFKRALQDWPGTSPTEIDSKKERGPHAQQE